ncbi:MAG TPA: hypothetical protein VGM06_11245 [Polyangiaceae bacterium]|jgi:hypothetical protein
MTLREVPITRRRGQPSRRARVTRSLLRAAIAAALAACTVSPLHAPSSGSPPAASEPPVAPVAVVPPAPAPELPRGGRTIFPDYRLVGFCGTPGAPALGELQGNLPAKAKELEAKAAAYGEDRKTMPVFELIAVVVQGWPGLDGKYRRRVDDSVVDAYLRAARASKALLLLNIQPGQSDFLTETKTFEKYLREPDVGVALDPEWAMKPKQRPGQFFGQTTGAVISDVAAYLSTIVKENNLPEKVLVFHQVNREVVKDETTVTAPPGVVVIKSIDGLGPVHAKIVTYDYLMKILAQGVHPGFKLFFDEDTRNGGRLMAPSEVLALTPRPEYVMYE